MIEFPQEIVDMYKEFKPAHEKIYRIIRDSLFLGKLHTQEKFTEQAVAQALGCSRTPVRTALARLHSEGLLQNVTKNNIGIQELSEKEMMDILTLDMLLEGQAAYQTALNGISDDDMDTLYTINHMIAGYRTLNESVNASNYGVRDLHMQFHLLIAKYADNRFLYKEIVSIRNIMRSLQSAAVYEERNIHNYSDFVAPTHQKILRAIQDKDPDEARMMMQYEISQSRDIYRTSHLDVNYSPE